MLSNLTFPSRLSRVQLFVTLWTLEPTRLLLHGIFPSRILEWVIFPSPEDLPDPGIEPVSLVSPPLQEDFLTLSHQFPLLGLLQRLNKRTQNTVL